MNGFKKNKETAHKIVLVAGKYEAFRDKYQWVLTEHYESTSTKGVKRMSSRDSYHSNLGQVCSVILDRTAGECESLEALLHHYETAPALWVEELGEG